MKRLLIGLALIPVILLCVMLFILGTESGLRFALWQANIWAPDTLTVESVDGKLTGPLDINGLSLSTSAQQLNVDTIAFRWTPSALFKRQLIIDKLAVDGIVVTVGGPSEPVEDEPADPFTLPERLALPASVFLQDIALTNIQIYTSADAESVLINEVAIDLQYQRESDGLNTNVLMQSELLSAELTMNAVARDEYPIDGQINWSANVPELARVDGNTSLSGTINELTIIQSVAKPYAVEANVVLRDTLTALSIDAQGQVGVESINAIKSDLPAVGIAGDFAFKGEPLDGILQSTLHFDGELPGPINSTLLVNINQQLITLNSLTISVGDQPLELSASGSIDISGPEPLADLEIRWREFAWPWNDAAQMLSATGSAQLTGSPADATVSIDTTFNEIGAINGTVTLNGQDIDATIDWSSLQWPLDGSVASNITGRLAVGERIDGYTLSLNTAVDTPQLSGILLSANGAGTQQSLHWPSLSLNAADGTLTGDLQLTWAPSLSFTTTLVGEKFNPSIFFPDFPGNLSIAVKAQGDTVDEVLEMELDTMMISGVLRDQPFDANVRASLKGADLTIDTLTLDAGSTALVVSGIVSDNLDVSFALNSPELSKLLPEARGSMIGRGSLGGPLLQPSLKLELTGRSLTFGEFSLQALDLISNIDTRPTGPVVLELSLANGSLPGLELGSFKVNTQGSVDAHTISLSGRTNQGDVDLSLNGSLSDQTWRYTMESATLAYPSLAPWRLEKPASGALSKDTQSISYACLVSQDARICTSAQRNAKALTANYSLTRFALDTINSFLPAGTRLSGTIDSEGNVILPAGSAPNADVSATLKGVAVDIDNSDGESVRLLSVEPGQFTGVVSDKGASINVQLNLGQQGNIEANALIAGSADELIDGALSGRISGSLDTLTVVEQLVPVLEDVKGRVAMDFTLGGSPRVPTLDGVLTLSGGNVAFVGPGIVVSDATARVTADGGSRLGVAVTAKSNEGSMRVDGMIDLATLPTPVVSLTVKGEQFEVVNTLEAEAALSPDLSIQFDDKGLVVNGEVGVPVLAITPKKVPAGVVAVSGDQQVVGEETDNATAVPVNVRANVKIVLGQDVFIDAFGLNASLAGSLAVKEVPGKETTATGQLQIVDGTFKAYGQNLVIEKGNIIYAGGPIAKPGFEIDAVRKVTSELQVGIRARGALANPQFSLFSTPPMSESEQMSYLILGRPLQDNTPSENSAMRKAAMALGVAGGKLLTEKFGDKLGLDQVAIDSELRETGEQAALVVGKYLSPRLFVSYGIGLFEPVSTLKLDYTINRNIKLISETTESNSGGDIVFTFEGGK